MSSSAELPPGMPLTKNLRINRASLKEARDKYPSVLVKLHDTLPKSVYPTSEAAPDEEYHGAPFYPGRVLLGTNDGALIWAYLRKMSTSSKDNNRSNMEIFYSDYGSDEDEGRTRFHMSEFAPWCSLLVGDKAPLGSDKWEERVKIVVKIVMLEAGYCDLTMYAFPPTMHAAIRANIDEGVDYLPRATMTIPKTPSSDIPAETVVPSAPRRGRRPDQYGGITVKEDPAKFYIQT